MISWIIRVFFGAGLQGWFGRSMTNNGQASSRKMSAYYLMMLYGVSHISYLIMMFMAEPGNKHNMAQYLLYFMIVDVVGALLYLGIVTIQNITMAMRYIRANERGVIPPDQVKDNKKPEILKPTKPEDKPENIKKRNIDESELG